MAGDKMHTEDNKDDNSVSAATTTAAQSAEQPAKDQSMLDALSEGEKELMELLVRKRQLEKNLASIESNIHALEGSYLEDSQYGNIVRGFDGYISNRTDRRKTRVNDADRIFSLSSAHYRKASLFQQKDDM